VLKKVPSKLSEEQFSDYRLMTIQNKAKLLVDQDEVNQIEAMLRASEAQYKAKGVHPDPQLFKTILQRIYWILKQNYLPEFF